MSGFYKYISIVILAFFVTEVFYINGLSTFFNMGPQTYIENLEDSNENKEEVEKFSFDYKNFHASLIAPNFIEVRTLRYIQKSIVYSTPFIEISSPPPNFSC